MDNKHSTSLVIKEHDFQEAKNSLKKYTEQAQKEVELSKVPNDGGLFNLGNHKVTGSELNQITSQIQDYLIKLNNLNQGLVSEFGQVYKAFEYLDKDYIAGIVASIKSAEEVSKQEQKDRKDIRKLVEQHEQSVAVLKKFKADIDKLKHLTDIDKAWELIEEQTKLSKEFSDYLSGLSQLEHLDDVDTIYTNLQKLGKEFSEVSENQLEYTAKLKVIREFCDSLSNVQHIKDIDQLWDSSKVVAKDIQHIKKFLDEQRKAISELNSALQAMQDVQQRFIEKVNLLISDLRKECVEQVRSFTEAQTIRLNNIERGYTDAINKLLTEQQEKLASIEKAQSEVLGTLAKEQVLAVSRIENGQREGFEKLSADQSAALEQISSEQSRKLSEISKSFEAEKTILNEQAEVLTQKIKYAYWVAGGALALTVIQLFLNILGVI